MAKLYVVEMSIGCPDDLTLRALHVLKQVSCIVIPGDDEAFRAASASLLARYGVQTPVCQVPVDEAERAVHTAVKALALGDVAWLQPGAGDAHAGDWNALSLLCERGVAPVVIPGPSMAMAALAVSGLPTAPFVLLGSLPLEAEARRAMLHSVATERSTIVCALSAGSPATVLDDCLVTLGDRPVALWHTGGGWRGRISQAPALPTQGPIAVVIAGAASDAPWSEEQVRQQMQADLEEGRSARDVASDLAVRSGWPRRRLYAMLTELHSDRRRRLETDR